MATFEIYYEDGAWHLDYDGDAVAQAETPIEVAQDMIAFMGLDAAIGTAVVTPIVDTE